MSKFLDVATEYVSRLKFDDGRSILKYPTETVCKVDESVFKTAKALNLVNKTNILIIETTKYTNLNNICLMIQIYITFWSKIL